METEQANAPAPGKRPDKKMSARERLLAAADELFYREGIHTVGIDRVIEHAGVAKASLYDCFGSKEELIRAYLQARLQARQERLRKQLAGHASAAEKILCVFDGMAERMALPGYRGCPFVRATAEARADSAAAQVCAESRAAMLALFTQLAGEAGAAAPAALGRQLLMLYDGATLAADIDHDTGAATTARTMAALALGAATRGG